MNNEGLNSFKRIVAMILCVCLVITMTPVPFGMVYAETNAAGNEITSGFAGGSGTEDDPYQISTKAQLDKVRENLSAHYQLTNDIKFEESDFAEEGAFYNGGSGWLPIGTEGKNNDFSGVFNGNGYKISGLKINTSDSYAGLFGYVTGVVENVGTENEIVISTTSKWAYAGGIAGRVEGSISDCYNIGNVSVESKSSEDYSYAYAGGIAGFVSGDVSSCYNTGNISAGETARFTYAGGIAGRVNGSVNDCHSTGNISASAKPTLSKSGIETISCAGGIAGYLYESASDCYNTGSVSAETITGAGYIYSNAGGISGLAYSYASESINTCYNTGDISASASSKYAEAGGIAGVANYDIVIRNCYNTGSVSGTYSGGIAGELESGGYISNCYSTGSASGTYCGGIVGSKQSSSDLSNCYYLTGIGKNTYTGTTALTPKQLSNSENYKGFDFEKIWTIDNSIYYQNPYLKGFDCPSTYNINLTSIEDIDSYVYIGAEIRPAVNIKNGSISLIEGLDYYLRYDNNIEVGKATVTITGKGNYKGEVTKEFTITCNHIWDDGAVTKAATCAATGVKTFECTVTGCGATKTETIAKAAHSYSSSYTVDKKATMSENGSKSKHCSKCSAKTSVTAIPKISTVKLSATEFTYNGKKKTPSVTVKDSKGKTLVKDTDYTVKYSSTSRTKIGRYYATVTFKGNYSGSKKIYFTIGPKNPSSVKTVLYGYDDVKVSWSKVSGASGYVVYYKKASASSYTKLKTTTSTSYKKSGLSAGVKYDFKVVAYKTVSGNKCYNAGKTSSITTLKKVSGVKATKSSSKVKVSWTNIGGETGYQISQSTSKSKTNVVATYKTTSGKSKTISATKGKTYYYKVRAYKTVGDKKIYGPWSSVVKYKR